MQYRTTELLWITAGASVYAWNLAVWASRGRLDWNLLSNTPAAVVFAGAVWWWLARHWRRSLQVLGRPKLSVRPPAVTIGHVVALAYFGLIPGLAGAFANQGSGQYEVASVIISAVVHAAIEACGRITFCWRGVLVRRRSRLWKDHRFELRRDESRLVCREAPNESATAPIFLSVPRSRLDEIAAILDEHQPPAEA